MRPFPLDGAMLLFDPATGTHVRVENQNTRGLMRQAPRVAMFGITNACNLDCVFCSRDQTRASAWTVATAAETLRGLSRAGTLEVAFGGGEPFVFRGFADLLAELKETTRLACHVTTNGTLITPQSWHAYRGLLGQVRISIYDQEWRLAAETLAAEGQRWGANVLVDRAMLTRLPALLDELHALRCHDASILSYVGDGLPQLSTADRGELARILAASPVACRLSVCMLEGECGAGTDFVSITPDKRMQACSFQNDSVPAENAEQILAAWRERRSWLMRPSPREGCSRGMPVFAERLPPIAIWQSFSGNNSGECILVGKFDTREDAEKCLAELLPGWVAEAKYSNEWKALFGADNEWREMPAELLTVGKTLIATGYDSGDLFPELRAHVWQRSGYVVAGGIHLHEAPVLVGAFGKELVALPTSREHSVTARVAELKEMAGELPLAAELFLREWNEEAFLEAKKRRGVSIPTRPRLAVYFYGDEGEARAAKFAAKVNEATVHHVGGCVLIEGIERRKRLAVLAIDAGARVDALDGVDIEVVATIYYKDKARRVDVAAVAASLSEMSVTERTDFFPGATIAFVTADPGAAMRIMADVAKQHDAQLLIGVRDPDRLGLLVQRLLR